MKKHNIAILYGGQSGEHEVSLRSASSVERHLNKDKYNIHLIGITTDGLWYYQENYSNNTQILEIIKDKKNLISLVPGKGFYKMGEKLEIDFIFPILHGTYGEDGTMQGLLEIIGIPYAGSGMDGSYLAMDKEIAKIIWEREGLPIVPFLSAKNYFYKINPEKIKKECEEKFNYPMFIKPVKAGSSVGVSRVDSANEFHPAMEKAFKFDTKLIIEPAVNAREIECSVVGNYNTSTFALGEIAPSHKFYDYDAKYIDPDGAKLIIPAEVDSDLTNKMKEIAEKAYLALNLKGFSRVDFFLDKDTNKIMINEINTIPGFTNISMFSMLCAHEGLEYPELLDKLFELGMEHYKEINSLDFMGNK